MELSDDTPLTREQFNEEVKRLGPEALLQPHIRTVTRAQMESDGTIPETEEYAAATEALKRGVTMFVGRSDANARVAGKREATVKIEPRQFICWKESAGEVASHRTAEFGSVSTGTRRDFPRNPPLYQGTFRKALAGTVICWEADHSSSEWYNKLIQGMRDTAEMAKLFAIDVGHDALNQLVGILPGAGDYSDLVFWIENIATLIAALLEWLRNKDDKVCEHNIGYSVDWFVDR
ncbi:hypothetical protein BDV23DRAFT_193115 [Aspergillus alliaceus]|uniref:Uncharacterized protein n=1 Tax=Petromyces alliaceus TaxID=209559 RepID=A0A5N7CBQ2_PETAA|nr:hypothetical protein BDV23DRAFT_193115 [Aspergillus alliaceus]